MVTPLLVSLLLLAGGEEDPRAGYDVRRYDLALEVDPDTETLSGSVTTRARVTADSLEHFVLDLKQEFEVLGVSLEGAELPFEHRAERVRATLPSAAGAGDELAVTVTYRGQPKAAERAFSGFHWAKTADGRPWINTSCQGPGAHSWWPCKASFYHPQDKPDDGIRMSITAPEELYAVSNGRLERIEELEGDRRTFHWVHPYPLETYTVTLNVAPYVVVESELTLPGVDEPVPWIYYVLPENVEKAAVQFQQVPELLEIFTRAFGPWPFPEAKFALVETNFWGMEHSTAVAYGSSYPAWCQANGERDAYANRNRDYDYILVHEVAHEWWGNAVSANAWGHFWIHEGFGTYAEGVYVEFTQGREQADLWFARKVGRRGGQGRLFRGEDVNSGQAYSGLIYSKGAVVLHALRHYVDDDEAWWRALTAFNTRFRYGNADTEDFQGVLEEVTGKPWKRFFEQWFYGTGYPELKGSVTRSSGELLVEVHSSGGEGAGFHAPLDLAWSEGGEERRQRLWLEPGDNVQRVPVGPDAADVRVLHLDRLAGNHDVEVKP